MLDCTCTWVRPWVCICTRTWGLLRFCACSSCSNRRRVTQPVAETPEGTHQPTYLPTSRYLLSLTFPRPASPDLVRRFFGPHRRRPDNAAPVLQAALPGLRVQQVAGLCCRAWNVSTTHMCCEKPHAACRESSCIVRSFSGVSYAEVVNLPGSVVSMHLASLPVPRSASSSRCLDCHQPALPRTFQAASPHDDSCHGG